MWKDRLFMECICHLLNSSWRDRTLLDIQAIKCCKQSKYITYSLWNKNKYLLLWQSMKQNKKNQGKPRLICILAQLPTHPVSKRSHAGRPSTWVRSKKEINQGKSYSANAEMLLRTRNLVTQWDRSHDCTGPALTKEGICISTILLTYKMLHTFALFQDCE